MLMQKDLNQWRPSRARSARRSQKSVACSADLLPLINKDFPALYAFQFQNAVLSPRIVLQFLSHFVFILGVEDQQRAAFIDQRATHQNETVIDKLIDELGVLVPKGLLTSALGEITVGAGGRNCQECTFDHGRILNARAGRQLFGSSAILSTTFPRV